MAYNRWLSTNYLAHHGVKGQKWGERNGPPYPLDRSKSDGHKLVKGDGSPQGKKKYKTSEKTAYKRAKRVSRAAEKTGVTDIESAKKKLREAGLNESSITEFELWAQEIPEKERIKWMQDMVKDANKSAESKKESKNLLSTIKDRIFGDKTNKSDSYDNISYEPQTSEKAKSRRGEAYEINDWNGNAGDTIKKFKRNPDQHINNARIAALSEARRFLSGYADTIPEVKRFLNMSNAALSKRIGLTGVSAYDRDTVEFNFGDINGDLLGHEITVEYDLDRRKVLGVSLNG